jgi:hypothetical protein
MSLSRLDWVLFAPGRLYAAPFVSEYLLYRLNDIDQSLLLRIEEGGVSTSEINHESLTIQTQVTLGWKPKCVFLHRSASARTPLRELGQMLPTPISLGSSQQEHRLDAIRVSLEPFQLPSARAFLPLDKKAPSMVHEIERTKYSVSLPDSLVSAPDFAKSSLDGVFFECYKVSIVNENTGRSYNLDSDQEWSLSALAMVIDWEPTYEGILRKSS